MKRVLTALPILLCGHFATSSSQAATVAMSGRIQGRLNVDWFNNNTDLDPDGYHNLSTIDYYFVEVVESTVLSVNWCATTGQGGNWGTGLLFRAYPYSDPFADLTAFVGGSSFSAGNCELNNYTIPTGRFVFAVAVLDAFDGGGGVVPLSYSESGFADFAYQGL